MQLTKAYQAIAEEHQNDDNASFESKEWEGGECNRSENDVDQKWQWKSYLVHKFRYILRPIILAILVSIYAVQLAWLNIKHLAYAIGMTTKFDAFRAQIEENDADPIIADLAYISDNEGNKSDNDLLDSRRDESNGVN